uniref:Carboxypeptidase inhibitor SmCI n=1 Tax=Sabellastarte magnifica TaxID=389514 RepID=PCPI_SABMA
ISVCDLPADRGQCTAYIPQWFFNKTTEDCEKFVYGGCQGNANRFETKDDCIANCGCNLPSKVGPCRVSARMWFHNPETEKCEVFIYGGCHGNANRFATETECQEVCDRYQKPGFCYQPSETGPCKGSFPRYYYDYEDGECKEFIYGGCEGNANNFETKESCENAC